MTEVKKDVRIKKKMAKAPAVKLPPNIEVRRELILKSIAFDYSKIIFVWSRSTNFPIDFAVHTLSKYGVITKVHYRWAESNGSNLQRGALVEFAKKNDAEQALKQYPYRNM